MAAPLQAQISFDALTQDKDFRAAPRAERETYIKQHYLPAIDQDYASAAPDQREQYYSQFVAPQLEQQGLLGAPNEGLAGLWNAAAGGVGEAIQAPLSAEWWQGMAQQAGDGLQTQFNTQMAQNDATRQALASLDPGRMGGALLQQGLSPFNPQMQAAGLGAVKGMRDLAQGVANAPADIGNTWAGRELYKPSINLPEVNAQVLRDNPLFGFMGEQLPFAVPLGRAAASGSMLKGLAEGAAIGAAYDNPEGLKGRIAGAAGGAALAGAGGLAGKVVRGMGKPKAEAVPPPVQRQVPLLTLQRKGKPSTKPVLRQAPGSPGGRLVDTVDFVRNRARRLDEQATKMQNLALVKKELRANEKKLGDFVKSAPEGAKQEALRALEANQARQEVVNNSLRQMAAEKKAQRALEAETSKTKESIQAVRDIRKGVENAAKGNRALPDNLQPTDVAQRTQSEALTGRVQTERSAGGRLESTGRTPAPTSELKAIDPNAPREEVFKATISNIRGMLDELEARIQAPEPKPVAPKPKAAPKAVEPDAGPTLEKIADTSTRKRQTPKNQPALIESKLKSGERRYKGEYLRESGYKIDSGTPGATPPNARDAVWRVMPEGKDTPIERHLTFDEAITVAKAHRVAKQIEGQVDYAKPQNNVALARDLLDDADYVPKQVRTEFENIVRAMEDGVMVEARVVSEAAGSRVESTLFNKVDQPLYVSIAPRTGDIYAMVINENGQLTRRYFREGLGSGYVIRDGKRVKLDSALVSEMQEVRQTKQAPKYAARRNSDGTVEVYNRITGEVIKQETGGLVKASEVAKMAAKAVDRELSGSTTQATGAVTANLQKMAEPLKAETASLVSKAPKSFKKAVFDRLAGLECD